MARLTRSALWLQRVRAGGGRGVVGKGGRVLEVVAVGVVVESVQLVVHDAD